MIKETKKYKIVALLLALVVLTTSIPLTIMGLGNRNSNSLTVDNASAEDKKIASQISNETGVSIDEVFELKAYGRSWNDVLMLIRNKSTLGENSKKKQREDLLLNSGLDDEFINKLKKEGFNDDEITEVKLIEERVMFQLEEITSETLADKEKILPQPNDPDITGSIIQTADKPQGYNNLSSDDGLDSYQELYKKVDVKDAVYFMLQLKADFGSYENAFDEYLFALQTGLDLNEYIKDKKAYLKIKDEKKLLLDERKLITLEKIENKSIEKTQTENKESDVTSTQDYSTNKGTSKVSKDQTIPLPDVPKPNSVDVTPKNPTDEIMNEIKQINPMENSK